MSPYRCAVEIAIWAVGAMLACWVAYNLGFWAEMLRVERLQWMMKDGPLSPGFSITPEELIVLPNFVARLEKLERKMRTVTIWAISAAAWSTLWIAVSGAYLIFWGLQ